MSHRARSQGDHAEDGPWLGQGEATPRLLLFLTEDPEAAGVAKLRIFAGLSVEEAAQALSTSRASAYRQWTYARAWLHARLGTGAGPA